MPTMVIFKGERSLDELTSRLFRVGGDPRARKLATDALLKVNPQLSDLARVPAGSVIVVPDTAMTVDSGEAVQPVERSVSDAFRSASDQITAAIGALPAASASAASQINAVLKLIKDRTLAAAASKDQELAQRLIAITNGQNSALKNIRASENLVQSGLAQIQADLAKLLPPAMVSTTGRASPPTPHPLAPNESLTPVTPASTTSRTKPLRSTARRSPTPKIG